MAEMELQRRGGQLIARYDAKVQLGFLLTGLRQRLMSFAYALPRRLVNKTEHEIGRLLDAEVRAALKDITTWPERGWPRLGGAWKPSMRTCGRRRKRPKMVVVNVAPAAKRERRNAGRRQKYAASKEG